MLISTISTQFRFITTFLILIVLVGGIGCQNSTNTQKNIPDLSEFKKVEPEQVNKTKPAPSPVQSQVTPAESQGHAKAAVNKRPVKQTEQKPPSSSQATVASSKPTPSKPKTTKPKAKPKKANILFEESTHHFGEITEGDVIKHKFKFKNTGKAELIIKSASASCGCTDPSYPFLGIPPGEDGFIGVTYYSVSKDGPQKPEIIIKTNASDNSIVLYLEGTVVPKKKTGEKSKEKIDSSGVLKNQ